MCTHFPLYAIKEPFVLLLQKMACWIFNQEYKLYEVQKSNEFFFSHFLYIVCTAIVELPIFTYYFACMQTLYHEELP